MKHYFWLVLILLGERLTGILIPDRCRLSKTLWIKAFAKYLTFTLVRSLRVEFLCHDRRLLAQEQIVHFLRSPRTSLVILQTV